jgi:GTPase KRas
MTEYRLIIFGTAGVGKSTLTYQMVQKRFVEEVDPTIEDSYRAQRTIDDETCLLDICDTAHNPEYAAMNERYHRSGKGYLIIYAITSRSSFEEVISFQEYILQLKNKERDEVPMILVGNKRDLEEERQVTSEEGRHLARSMGCQFFESSAKARINVEEPFFELVRQVRKQEAIQLKATKKNKKKTCLLM